MGCRGQIPAQSSGRGHWFLTCGPQTPGHPCRQRPHPSSCFLDVHRAPGTIPPLLSLKLPEHLTDVVGLYIFPKWHSGTFSHTCLQHLTAPCKGQSLFSSSRAWVGLRDCFVGQNVAEGRAATSETKLQTAVWLLLGSLSVSLCVWLTVSLCLWLTVCLYSFLWCLPLDPSHRVVRQPGNPRTGLLTRSWDPGRHRMLCGQTSLHKPQGGDSSPRPLCGR